MIDKIQLTNYKSITNKDISLGNFNVFVGANATGKSNFVDGFRFIKDAKNEEIPVAISRRFGWTNVLRRGIGKKQTISFMVSYDFSDRTIRFTISQREYRLVRVRYHVEIGYGNRRYHVLSEKYESISQSEGKEYKEYFHRIGDRVKYNSLLTTTLSSSIEIPVQLREKLFLKGGFFLVTSAIFDSVIDLWRFYDFDVKLARMSCIDTGQDVLASDACNLSLILDRISKSKNPIMIRLYDRILRVMSILVPQFDNWKTQRQFDNSINFSILEKGIEKPLIPGMISDGTIRLLSLLLALLYRTEQGPLICIDEPERYLHPQVLEEIVGIMREVSKKTQLIITTHSPELVKHLNPNELFLVDKVDNITEIVNAKSKDMVDEFLKEFTLDELWLMGHLEGGKAI